MIKSFSLDPFPNNWQALFFLIQNLQTVSAVERLTGTKSTKPQLHAEPDYLRHSFPDALLLLFLPSHFCFEVIRPGKKSPGEGTKGQETDGTTGVLWAVLARSFPGEEDD